MVGFALTVLQRRLASSPEAISRACAADVSASSGRSPRPSSSAWVRSPTQSAGARQDQPCDGPRSLRGRSRVRPDDATAEETEDTEESTVDLATAARTITELEPRSRHCEDSKPSPPTCAGRATDTKWMS